MPGRSDELQLLENFRSSPGAQWLVREVHDRRDTFRRQLESHQRTDTMIDIAFKQGYVKALSDVLDLPGTLERQETEDGDDE